MDPIAHLRKNYTRAELDEAAAAAVPLLQFEQWLKDAIDANVPEPTSMTLATVGADGRPSTRPVLLKGCDASGFVWYTNYESRKGRELEANPFASLTFPWIAMERQVIVEGAIVRVSREESAAYFHSRPRASQLGAWVSHQSSVVPNRETLESSMKALEEKYAGAEVPLPPYWGGYRLLPDSVEFWQGRRSRLHDRLRYTLQADGGWLRERLAP